VGFGYCSDVVHVSTNHMYTAIAYFNEAGELVQELKKFGLPSNRLARLATKYDLEIPEERPLVLCPAERKFRRPQVWDVYFRLQGVPYESVQHHNDGKRLGKGVLGDKMFKSAFLPSGKQRVHGHDVEEQQELQDWDAPLPRGCLELQFMGTRVGFRKADVGLPKRVRETVLGLIGRYLTDVDQTTPSVEMPKAPYKQTAAVLDGSKRPRDGRGDEAEGPAAGEQPAGGAKRARAEGATA